METDQRCLEDRVVQVEASDFVLKLPDLSVEMMHLVESRRALACSSATEPANEMQYLLYFMAAIDFIGGGQHFHHDLVHLA